MASPDPFDPKRLVLSTNGKPTVAMVSKQPSRHRPVELFLKGPIPWGWLCVAAQLPGKTLAVALLIWFLAGLRKHRTVKWEPSKGEMFGLDRHTAYRAQGALEEAGLIKIKRQRGRSPEITIVKLDRDHHAGND